MKRRQTWSRKRGQRLTYIYDVGAWFGTFGFFPVWKETLQVYKLIVENVLRCENTLNVTLHVFYMCELLSEWPQTSFSVCYVNLHGLNVNLEHRCSQGKCMPRWEVWEHYATKPPLSYTIRGSTFTSITPSTFLMAACMSLSPFCTSDKFQPRSRLASLQSLPAVFQWAEFVSRWKISILQ